MNMKHAEITIKVTQTHENQADVSVSVDGSIQMSLHGLAVAIGQIAKEISREPEALCDEIKRYVSWRQARLGGQD